MEMELIKLARMLDRESLEYLLRMARREVRWQQMNERGAENAIEGS